MKLFATILNADGTPAGDGPVFNIRSASVTRALDGAGSVSIDVPGTDKRAIDLLQNKRRMIVYVQDATAQTNTLRELGRGIVDEINRSDSASGWNMTVDGPDILGELKYGNTLFARTYNQQTLSEIVTGLVNIMPEWNWSDWESSASGTDLLISARYDAVTVLKALQSLVAQQGLHLRLGTTGKRVEVGAFGDTIDALRLVNPKEAAPELYTNDDVALIDRIRTSSASEDIITWMLPLAGGQNVDSALTLQYATANRWASYPVLSMTGPDGRTLYYIKKQSAVDLYGIIPKVGTFKDISPLSNTTTDIRNAANACLDAAVATLERYSAPQETYNLTVRKCVKTVRPGDKVHISYRGDVELEDGDGRTTLRFREIEGDFWVMKATERFGVEGGALELTVSTIDRYTQDMNQVVLNGLEQISIQGLNVQPSFCLSPYGPYQRAIDNVTPVEVPLRIGNAFFALDRCLLQIKSTPLQSTVRAAAASPHKHIFASPDTSYGGGFTVRQFRAWDPIGGVFVYYQLPVSAGALVSYATLNENPDHTHAMDYGLYTDVLYPVDLTVEVDGVVVASGLDAGGTGLDFEIDIAATLNLNLRTTHTITVTCDSGQGDLEISFELYPVITPFKLGS